MEPLEIGEIRLFPFGAVLALALGAGVVWSWRKAPGERIRKALEYFWLAAIPLGLVLAHLGYCLCSLDMLEDILGETLLDFAGGGYLLYGALAGATIALGLACRASGAGYGETADLLAGPFLLLGAACAFGEGLIGAGYGWKVDDWFLSENSMSLLAGEEPGALGAFFSHFPFALRDPFYGYASWAVFLPVGLALTGGAVCAARMRADWPGEKTVFSGSMYAVVRVLYESLRQDDIPKWGFVRVNQILSAVVLVILLIICWRRIRKGLGTSLGFLLGGALLVLVMEFALEKKIGFLEWMTMDLCYLVSGLGCWMMYHAVNRLRKQQKGLKGATA